MSARRGFIAGSIRAFLSAGLVATLAAGAQNQARQPYLIGAWYFTAWSSAHTGLHPRQTQKIYGRRDPWGGVRDYAQGKGKWPIADPGSPRPVDYSGREPLIGFYDLMSQETMDAQILEAASRGLSYFDFYYYWDKDKNAESDTSAPLQRFLSSPQKPKMRFLLAPIMLGRAAMTPAIWKSCVDFMVGRYLTDDSYLTDSDGRPILMDFNSGFVGRPQEHREAIEYLRAAARSRLGRDPLVLLVVNGRNTRDDLKSAVNRLKVDGFSCFQFGPHGKPEEYAHHIARWRSVIAGQWPPSGMAAGDAPVYVPCATTGFDARPWFNIGWGPWMGESPDGPRFRQPNDRPFDIHGSPELFESHLRDLKSFIDSKPRKTLKMLTIYAWNEWGEGGVIEPSKKLGYAYLDRVQKVFGLKPAANGR